MKQHHISRAGRKAQIVLETYKRYNEGKHPFMTTYSIAKSIGLAPSGHVKRIVNELIETGWLNAKKQKDMFGRDSVIHWPTVDACNLMEQALKDYAVDWKTVKDWFEQ